MNIVSGWSPLLSCEPGMTTRLTIGRVARLLDDSLSTILVDGDRMAGYQRQRQHPEKTWKSLPFDETPKTSQTGKTCTSTTLARSDLETLGKKKAKFWGTAGGMHSCTGSIQKLQAACCNPHTYSPEKLVLRHAAAVGTWPHRITASLCFGPSV